MTVRPLITVLVGLMASSSGAQTTAHDDFEGKLLSTDVPPGIWGYRFDLEPANFFGTSPAAAKVGGFGLRCADVTPGAAFLSPNGIVLPLPADIFQQYARFWFRGSNHNQLSEAKITSLDLTPLGLPAAEIYYSDKLLRLKYFNRVSAQFVPHTEVLAADGQWVLLELFVSGVGTTNGTVAFSIDGQLRSVTQGIDWVGERVSAVGLGNLYGQGDFMATLDFDNYRTSPEPQAAAIVLVGPAEIPPGACVLYTLQVRNSFDGGSSPAPDTAVVQLSQTSDAGVVFSANASCTVSAAAVQVDAGSVSANLFVRAAANERITLMGQSPDYPDFKLSVLVDGGLDAGAPDAGSVDAGTPDAGIQDAGAPDAGTPDAGTPDAGTPDAGTPDAGTPDAGTTDAGQPDAGRGPASFAVGCGCTIAGTGELWALAGLLGLLARRRRVHPCVAANQDTQ